MSPQYDFSISSLTVVVDDRQIINDISFTIKPGEIHALVGSNGSGKSSLALTIMGHPQYHITQGNIVFDGQNLNRILPYQRARLGLFLAFQEPISIPGLSVSTLLREIIHANSSTPTSHVEFQKLIKNYLKLLDIDHTWLERNINENFSGGEKKRLELLQMMVAQPKIAILDEIDSGMDEQGITILKNAIHTLRSTNPNVSLLIISHNLKRLSPTITPHVIHTMNAGTIISSKKHINHSKIN